MDALIPSSISLIAFVFLVFFDGALLMVSNSNIYILLFRPRFCKIGATLIEVVPELFC
jgi:hypothetical protein